MNLGKCPECNKEIGNRQGGGYNQVAEGNRRIDQTPITLANIDTINWGL